MRVIEIEQSEEAAKVPDESAGEIDYENYFQFPYYCWSSNKLSLASSVALDLCVEKRLKLSKSYQGKLITLVFGDSDVASTDAGNGQAPSNHPKAELNKLIADAGALVFNSPVFHCMLTEAASFVMSSSGKLKLPVGMYECMHCILKVLPSSSDGNWKAMEEFNSLTIIAMIDATLKYRMLLLLSQLLKVLRDRVVMLLEQLPIEGKDSNELFYGNMKSIALMLKLSSMRNMKEVECLIMTEARWYLRKMFKQYNNAKLDYCLIQAFLDNFDLPESIKSCLLAFYC